MNSVCGLHLTSRRFLKPGTDDQEGFTGFEYNLVQYDKDEYIKMIDDKNSSLEQQMTDTQVALVEVYEMLG